MCVGYERLKVHPTNRSRKAQRYKDESQPCKIGHLLRLADRLVGLCNHCPIHQQRHLRLALRREPFGPRQQVLVVRQQRPCRLLLRAICRALCQSRLAEAAALFNGRDRLAQLARVDL